MTPSDTWFSDEKPDDTASRTARATVLGLVLAATPIMPLHDDGVAVPISYSDAQETADSGLLRAEIGDVDLFQQLNRVYDELTSNARDLEPETRRVLYAKRWDLYD